MRKRSKEIIILAARHRAERIDFVAKHETVRYDDPDWIKLTDRHDSEMAAQWKREGVVTGRRRQR